MAANRVVERYGARNVTLLCNNTRSEAPDWLTFVYESSKQMNARLVMLDEGLDIWELAFQQGMIPNAFAGFCSRILKREPSLKWLNENCDKAYTTVHLGFDYTELHRLGGTLAFQKGWKCETPLTWKPVIDKEEILKELECSSLPYPQAYELGLQHNNCLKYGCVKGGQAYWKQVLEQVPEAYARSEELEEAFRSVYGDYAILNRRHKGKGKALPLKVFREQIEAGKEYDKSDYGSCSCFGDDGA